MSMSKKTYRIAADEGWLQAETMTWGPKEEEATLFAESEWMQCSNAFLRVQRFKTGGHPRILLYLDGDLEACCDRLTGRHSDKGVWVYGRDEDVDDE
jgi:hypothetical protein